MIFKRIAVGIQKKSIIQLSWTRHLSEENIKPFDAIPGLTALPIIGIMHHFIPFFGTIGPKNNFFDMFEVLYRKYGSVVKMEGMLAKGTMVMFFEPDHYDKIYRAEEMPAPYRSGFQALEYYREELRKDRFNGVYGLTTAQGKKWRDFRTKVNPALLKPKIVKLYAPGLEEIADDLVARLWSIREDPAALSKEFETEITKWSLESVALVCLGKRIGCLQDNLSDDHPAKKLMHCSKTVPDLSFKLEFAPKFINMRNSSWFKELMKIFDTQWEVSEMYIEQAKKAINERGHGIPEEDQSILEKLLAIDEKVAVMMANEMLFAGIDTVSYAVTGLLYNLAVNKVAQDKLRQEIHAQAGSKYLKACVKESLRLLPVLSANLRQTTKEHIVAGYQIPAGTFAIAPNEYLSKLEKYYPQAREFIPERWLVDKEDPLYYGNAHPMVTLPFGFGVRSCIGRRIAELEIEILVKKLLDKVEVQWTGPPLKVVIKVINNFKKPYHFKFVEAK
ncbi:unnamed protein product [Chilo suppressalis]|uniref:Uncharacterized protein n=1 Tax=Chilo suppressalis TaxID=168631 RepID=A0ABN8L1D3_CHISP|nr:unnamed protein product [Chilo suppressalis]